MGLFDQFPYTNFHELNLDWIIAQIKHLLNEQLELKNLLKLYTPYFAGDYETGKTYPPLSVVQYNGNYYISKKEVPVGVTPDSQEYWMLETFPQWEAIDKLSKLNFRYPDMYEGNTDGEKIQNCLDSITSRELGAIVILTRNYELDRNILLPQNNNNYQNVSIIGIGKNASINFGTFKMYGRGGVETGQFGGGVTFENVFLYGTETAFDADTLIRLTFHNCNIQGFKYFIYSTSARGYMQDMNIDLCRFKDVGYVFRGSVGPYSGSITHTRMGDTNVIYVTDANISKFDIRDCNIEGFNGSTAISFKGVVKALSIENNYFENNKDTYHACIDLKDVYDGTISVASNYYHSPKSSDINVWPLIISRDTDFCLNVRDNFCQKPAQLFFMQSAGSSAMITNWHFDNNIGEIVDASGVIPLYKSNAPANLYPNRDINITLNWGVYRWCETGLTMPDNVECKYYTFNVVSVIDENGGISTNVPSSFKIQPIGNRRRFQVDAGDVNAVKNKTINVTIQFHYKNT